MDSSLLCGSSCSGSMNGSPKVERGAKRLISDADCAKIDNRHIPELIVLLVAALFSAASSTVVSLALTFKAVEFVFLVVIPAVAFIWGLGVALFPVAALAVLELEAEPSAAALVGAVVALAAHGALRVGFSGCAVTKARFLPLISLLGWTAARSPLLGTPPLHETLVWSLPPGLQVRASALLAALPLAAAVANSRGSAWEAYLKKGHKAALAARARDMK